MSGNIQDNSTPFLEEEQKTPSIQIKPKHGRGKNGFLGMTPAQRFVLCLLLFFLVCSCGTFILILTGKIALPS